MSEVTESTEQAEIDLSDLQGDFSALASEAAALDGEESPVNGKEAESVEAELSTGELMATAIQATADIIAPNWDIQSEESEALGNAYGALIDKYLPDNGLNNYGVEITALLVTGMVFKSRAGVPLRKPEKPEKAEESQKSSQEQAQEKSQEPSQEQNQEQNPGYVELNPRLAHD